ncbi:MAG TPA: hypothetical protein VFN48_09860 [Solirubrobacteraceae bacterium]|nr:hypothetical protein [Solirubrobacteraceae bacterium]
MAARSLAPYEHLVKLIEQELELAGAGRVEELQAAITRRGAHLASLTLPAPPEAATLLLRAEALHNRMIIETQRIAEALETTRRRSRRRHAVALTYLQVPPGGHVTSA